MELTSEDAFGQDLAALPGAPDFRAPTFGDDVNRFAHDLTQPGFGNTGRAVSATVSSALENDIGPGIADKWQMQRQYEPLVEALNTVQQRRSNPIANPYSFSFTPPQQLLDYIWGQVAQERSRNPGVFGQLPKDHNEVLEDARAEQRTSADYARQLQATGGPITGRAAGFVGGAIGGMADPINIAATIAGFPASESLLKTALIEGAGNAAADLAGLPGRMQHYQDIGEPMTTGDAAGEVAGSALLGAGFGAGGKLIAKVLGLHGHALVDEFHAENPDASPTLRTAATVVEDQADRAATNPFADTAQGQQLHNEALQATQGALDDGAPHLVPDLVQPAEDAARALAPEAFAVHESAAAEVDTLRQQIQALGASRADLPLVAHYQSSIEDILAPVRGVEARLTKTKAARLADLRDKLDQRMSTDTPQMAFLRHRLMQADFRMRDVGPEIAAAHAAAADRAVLAGKDSAPEIRADGVPDVHALPARIEAPADVLQHRRVSDPEALKPFSDPVKKPEAFQQQGADLARELSPPPEKPIVDSQKPAGGETKSSPYGETVAPQIDALDRLGDAATFADPLTGQTGTVKDAASALKRQARAVERLRGCVEGE